MQAGSLVNLVLYFVSQKRHCNTEYMFCEEIYDNTIICMAFAQFEYDIVLITMRWMGVVEAISPEVRF